MFPSDRLQDGCETEYIILYQPLITQTTEMPIPASNRTQITAEICSDFQGTRGNAGADGDAGPEGLPGPPGAGGDGVVCKT